MADHHTPVVGGGPLLVQPMRPWSAWLFGNTRSTDTS